MAVRRAYAGAAIQTTLTGSITSTSLTLTIADATGWPTGNPFYVVIDPGQTSEEKVLCTRSSTTLTVSSTANRGVDGTSATSHASGAVIYPCVTAKDLDEANVAAVALTDGIVAANIQSNAVTTAKILDANVTEDKLASSAVTESKLASGAVTTAKIGSGAVTLAKLNSEVGAWQNYTPTMSGIFSFAAGSLIYTGRYTQIGKTVHFFARAEFDGGTITIVLDSPAISLPVPPAATVTYGFPLQIVDVSTGLAVPGMTLKPDANNRVQLQWFQYGYPASGTTYSARSGPIGTYNLGNSEGRPFTFADGDYIIVSGTYEAA